MWEAKLKKNSSALFTTETQVVRKNRSAGVSPASEPRQLLLGQHDLCRLEAGDTFFLTTTQYTDMHEEPHCGQFPLRSICVNIFLASDQSQMSCLPGSPTQGVTLAAARKGVT